MQISDIRDGHLYEVKKTAYGLEITFIVSYIKQMSMWRIDMRVDDNMVHRKHYASAEELVEQAKVHEIDLE